LSRFLKVKRFVSSILTKIKSVTYTHSKQLQLVGLCITIFKSVVNNLPYRPQLIWLSVPIFF